MIKLAQWVRWRRDYDFSHAAIIVCVVENFIQVAEMEYPTWKLTTYDQLGSPTIIRAPDGINRQGAVNYALSRHGTHYGILTLFSILFNLFTPRAFRFDLHREGTLICSALVAWAWMIGGWWGIGDPYQVTPAELAAWAKVKE